MAEFPTPHAPLVKQTGLAVTTLVLGIIGLVICPPLGIAAIITGIIALSRIGNQPERYGGQGMAIAGLVCGCASILMAFFVIPMFLAILLPSVSRARDLSKRLACAYNMRAIGMATKQYASEANYQGELDLDGLVQAGYLTPEQTVCRSSGLAVSNYIVARPSDQERLADETIVLYEPLSNHGNEGGNFLYGDGHVMFNLRPLYDELVAEIRTSSH